MKRNLLIIAAFIGALCFAACGGDKDSKVMKKADKMYAQAEKTVQGIDNFDDFFSFIDEFDATKQEFLEDVIAPAYQVDEDSFDVPDEVNSHIYERATAYNHVEAVKYAELFEPYISAFEAALDEFAQAGSLEEKAALRDKVQEALDAAEKYATYDNVLPELQEREAALLEKMNSIEY